MTRAGKSTTFNWVLGHPLIGTGKINTSYSHLGEVASGCAEVGNGFGSVTLIPNIHVDFTESISFCDMAGYGDTRDYVGVIGVSYFIKALFERVRKVKFIVVISEKKFTDETGAGIIKTFEGFFNMFKLNLLTQ